MTEYDYEALIIAVEILAAISLFILTYIILLICMIQLDRLSVKLFFPEYNTRLYNN